MNNLLQIATREIAAFLGEHLPDIDPDWWNTKVISKLTFQQQRIVGEKNIETLDQLDLAALLRIFDYNWNELNDKAGLKREGRSWLKELQTVRNKWAHLPSAQPKSCDTHRDADTLARLLEMICASQTSLDRVKGFREELLVTMAEEASAKTDTAKPKETKDASQPSKQEQESISPFKVGDIVSLSSDPSRRFPIIEIIENEPEPQIVVFENNSRETYFQSQLEHAAAEEPERQMLGPHELSAFISSLHILSVSTRNLFSLHSGRIQFVPYQYRPVLKVIRSDRPRLLIADEVGVGKTIEAGLIIKELKARMDLSSILVICPRPLVTERKWFLEMKRFDETFTALDGNLLRHCMRETELDGEWPEQYSKAIIPFSLFDSNLLYGKQGKRGPRDEGLFSLDPPPKFDLVIVDEAHHIRNPDTFLHQGVRLFCDHAEAVLFLSATPVQLGSRDLFTLLNVLRPDVVIDELSFEQMSAPNRFITTAVEVSRSAGDDWQTKAATEMKKAAETEWGTNFLSETPAFQSTFDLLTGEEVPDTERVSLIRDIEELYTFSSIINRTRRRDIGEFTTRKPETVPIEFTESQRELHDLLLDILAKIYTACHGHQNVKFMMTTIRRQAASSLYGLAPLLKDILSGKLNQLELMVACDTEQEVEFPFIEEIRSDISELVEKVEALDEEDPKAKAFLGAVQEKVQLENNKVLVFSTFRHTLRYLAKKLEDENLRFGVIHGDVPDEERSELRYRFSLSKDDDEAIDVLLSSEIGCEGLDFQFCDFLVNYDLPWNPMRIEQRIGRIDRYGQKSEAVAIVNLITPGTVDADIYDRCLWRIGVFQRSIGGNEEILGSISQELQDIGSSFELTVEERNQKLKQIADNEILLVQEGEKLESEKSSLFGLNIPRESWESEIESAESFWLSQSAIQICVSAYLQNRIASEKHHISGGKEVKNLSLNQSERETLLADFNKLQRSKDSDARQWEKWLKKGKTPNLKITFSQEAASLDPKVVHLSITHPLVRQAALHWEGMKHVSVSVLAPNSDIAEGTYAFEIFRWRKQGVREDEELVSVASHPKVERELFHLLQTIQGTETNSPTREDLNKLNERHHQKWSECLANHRAANGELVEHKRQSLTISHQAREQAIQDQIDRAKNERIKTMKEGELNRAKADFDRRMANLKKAENSADIHTSPVMSGMITIKKTENGIPG